MVSLQVGPFSIPALLALAAILFGLIFMITGIALLRQQSVRRRTWTRMRGEAYDFRWSGGDNSSQYWLLRWTGPDGVQHQCQNPFGMSGGTARTFPFPVDLLVDPANPDRAQVAGGTRSGSAVAVIFTAFGAVVLVVGIAIAVLG
ncbi:MAG: hypothetical protein J2P23_02745 [Microlunatus sp.]|nr:hypothetical protein [Microlunatus sp.]